MVFQFQQTSEINGAQWTNFVTDAYPPGRQGLAIGSLVLPVDLRGSTFDQVSAQITALAVDPTSDAFWQYVKPDLSDPSTIRPGTGMVQNKAINDGSQYCTTILEGAGNSVSLSDFPNVLTKGQVTPWMRARGGVGGRPNRNRRQNASP